MSQQWSRPTPREHRPAEEHGVYSDIEPGFWVMVMRDGALVVGKDAEVIRLPAGASDAVLACRAMANPGDGRMSEAVKVVCPYEHNIAGAMDRCDYCDEPLHGFGWLNAELAPGERSRIVRSAVAAMECHTDHGTIAIPEGDEAPWYVGRIALLAALGVSGEEKA